MKAGNKEPKITLKMLREMDACPARIAWFRKRFPRGSTFAVAVATLAAEDRWGWAFWLALYAPAGVGAWRERLAACPTAADRERLALWVPAEIKASLPDYGLGG
jgi:hypothetical protein